jgi:endonuclease-3
MSTKRATRSSARDERSQARRKRARLILERLERAHPEATCALAWETSFELLTATILSAQCTDARVNAVTQALFRRYPTAPTLASAGAAELESLIRPTGFYRAKARSLLACAQALVTHHDGRVPSIMDDLVRLPGVGRKTANIVLGHAFDRNEGVAVDTHVLRVARRLGLTDAEQPEAVESDLMTIIPREKWTRISDLLIFHGRKLCNARKPRCDQCTIYDVCEWPGKPESRIGMRRTPDTRRRRPGGRAMRPLR